MTMKNYSYLRTARRATASVLVGLAGLVSAASTADAQDGCEYVTAVDFMEHVVSEGSDCHWSEDRGLYECTNPREGTWDLTIEISSPGDGRGTAVRPDGFTIVYTCSCTRICEFEDPDGDAQQGGAS